jgi:hypothetical protein
MKNDLLKFLKQEIVLDTRSSWVYTGVLEEVTDSSAVLSGVDVHDNKDTATTKELYILQTRTTGIKFNRRSVYVNLDYIVSFSRLEDVIQF